MWECPVASWCDAGATEYKFISSFSIDLIIMCLYRVDCGEVMDETRGCTVVVELVIE